MLFWISFNLRRSYSRENDLLFPPPSMGGAGEGDSNYLFIYPSPQSSPTRGEENIFLGRPIFLPGNATSHRLTSHVSLLTFFVRPLKIGGVIRVVAITINMITV
jgi:hypothetical protein